MDDIIFKNKLLEAGLTKFDFSELTNTPMPTIIGWTTKRNGTRQDCPAWVKPYLDLYIENRENKIYLKKILNKSIGLDNKYE